MFQSVTSLPSYRAIGWGHLAGGRTCFVSSQCFFHVTNSFWPSSVLQSIFTAYLGSVGMGRAGEACLGSCRFISLPAMFVGTDVVFKASQPPLLGPATVGFGEGRCPFLEGCCFCLSYSPNYSVRDAAQLLPQYHGLLLLQWALNCICGHTLPTSHLIFILFIADTTFSEILFSNLDLKLFKIDPIYWQKY